MNSYKQDFYILKSLVGKELMVRYQASFFGYLWAIANPVAFAIIYYFAFKVVMRIEMENYSLFMLSAMFPWIWFSTSILNGSRVFRENRSLVKKVKLNKLVLPLSVVLAESIQFIISFPVVFGLMYILGVEFTYNIYFIPFLFVLTAIFIFSIALFFSVINVFVNDVEYILGISISLLFFLTPIVYSVELVPDNYKFIYSLNPASIMVELWRGVFYYGVVDHAYTYRLMGYSVALISLSIFVYNKLSPKIAEVV